MYFLMWKVVVVLALKLVPSEAEYYGQAGSSSETIDFEAFPRTPAATLGIAGLSQSPSIFQSGPNPQPAQLDAPRRILNDGNIPETLLPGGSSFFKDSSNQNQDTTEFPFSSFVGVQRPIGTFQGVNTGDFSFQTDQLNVSPPNVAAATFGTKVIQGQITPTVTRTITKNVFTTLTDLILNSVGITQTQFVLHTTTAPTQQVNPTPVDDFIVLSTAVAYRPEYITLTETQSNFRIAVKTSVNFVTLTHTSYSITHVPFTMTATEVVTITSPVIRTVINTAISTVTQFRTVANTVYVRSGYL